MKHLNHFVFSLLCLLLSANYLKAQDTSWYSDSETTFTLTTKEQLLGFRDLVNNGKTFEGKTIKLESDIVINDFSTKSLESDGLFEWKPIGTETRPFKGTFDGDGHSIYGIYISKGSYVGFFGFVQNGTIQNLSIKNLYIQAYNYVGGIAGYCDNTTITNCINKGYITFNDYGGGICGSIAHGTITKCCNYGNIVSTYAYVDCGGIVGSASDSNITLCANYSSIESAGSTMSRTGGIVGWFHGEDKVTRNLTNCFNKGDIKGKFVCGGIIGYASGTAGYTSVSRCINYGKISVTSDVGAIVAHVYDSWKLSTYQCYYLDNSCTKAGWGSPVSKTEQQLKSQDFLDSFNSNDFWKFGNDGFPTLSFINEDEPAFLELKNIFFEESVTLKLNIPTAIVPKYFPFFAEKKLRWQSANEQIATVDQDGKVTGIAPGETKIIVTDNLTNVQASCNVSVIMEVGDTFKADIESSSNNVSTTFMLTDLENRYVSIGDGTNAAIATATTGSIVIPESIVGPGNLTYTVTSVGNKAFASSNISSVTIPQGISNIGDNAFNGCSNLTSVTVELSEPLTINSTCFSNASNATLNVPKGCYETYAIAENWSKFKSIVEPPHIVGDLFNASVTAGSDKTDMCFRVIDAENKYVSVGMGIDEELGFMPSIPDYTSGKVVIPSTVKGHDGQTYKVTQLSAGAFFGCAEVTSVVLPSTVTEIGQAAFYGCAALSSFTIPSSVKSIGDDAFIGCSKLSSITIPATVVSLGSSAFYDCNKLTSVTVNWSMPIAIDKDCFTNAANATLNVPKGSYENYAVADNWKSFKTLKEPAHSIDETFVAYVMANGVKTSARYKVTNTTSKYVSIGNGEESAISDFTSGTVVVPASVTGYDGQTYQVKQVSAAAFFGCSEVSSIELPSGITSIGQAAFYMCSALASFAIPTKVTSIGEDAFSYCENLQEITIPKNVNSIGSNAFTECGNLTSVTVEWSNPITINSDCFSNASNATLYVPCETKELYGSADGWEMFKEIVEIYKDGDVFKELIDGNVEMTFKVISAADKTCQVGTGNSSEQAINKETAGAISIPRTINGLTVEKISDYALFHCESLSDITIPNSVTSIGMNALRGCSSLRSIIVPSSVNSIGLAALACNKNLESIVVESGNTIYDSRDNCNAIICTATNELISGCKETIIPNSVTSIGRSAFNECYNLSEMTIPTSVTSIGQYAFYGCSDLTKIDIPKSVTSIGLDAFEGCSKLNTVSVEWDEPITIDYNCFSNAANAVLYVPIETNSKYKAATGWKNFEQIVNKTNSILFADDVIVCRGGQITLPIMLSNKDNVRNVQFELALPEGFSVVTNEMGELVGASLSERAKATHTITGTPEANGNYRVMIMPKGITDDVIQGSEGLIANIKLKVKLNVVPSDYDIKMTACELGIDDGESYSAILQDGYSKLTVSSVLLGDIKDNGEVTVTDVSNLIDYLLHKKVSNFTMHAADINGDGKISVTDISILIDILLHKTVFGEKQALKIEEISQ